MKSSQSDSFDNARLAMSRNNFIISDRPTSIGGSGKFTNENYQGFK